MSLIDKQLTGQTPRAGTMSHGITAGGVARPLLVNDDGTVNVTGGGGGTEYTEGATDTTITGSAMMWEDTGDTLRAVSASKPLPVSFTGGGDASAANQTTIIGHVDGIETLLGTIDTDTGGIATSTESIDTKTPALGQALAAGSVPVVLTASQLSTLTPPAAITGFATETTLGSIKTAVETIDNAISGAEMQVDIVTSALPTGASTLAEQQSQTTHLATIAGDTTAIETAVQLIDDTVTTLGTTTYTEASTKGITIGAVRRDANTTLVNTTNELAPLQVNATGELKVVQIQSLPAGTNAIGKLSANSGVDIGDVDVTSAVITGGAVAHDGADSGNPIKVGGQARTTNPTAVADGDRSNFITDDLGKLVVVGSIRDLKGSQQTSISSSTSETTIVTAVASTFLDLYGLVITNTSATACKVTIKDSTTGTTRFIFQVPATETRGFMVPESGAHNQASVNNNWTATCGTSVATIEITALYVKNI